MVRRLLARILLLVLLPSAEAFVVQPSASHSQKSRRLLASVQNYENATSLSNRSNLQSNTAVILNINARSVSRATCEIAKEVFQTNVYITTSHEESQTAMQRIMAIPPKLIIPVGGDGTLTSCINDCLHELEKQYDSLDDAMKHLPVFGYIPLGTGNGVGSVVGLQVKGRRRRTRRRNLRQIFEKLKAYAAEESSAEHEAEIVHLPMMSIQAANVRRLCFFAGVGFDSMMLDDFKNIKQWSQRTGILQNLLSSVSGYCLALVLKTLPKAVQNKHTIQVSVTTHDEDALWIDHRRGDFVVPVSSTLFEGTTGILAAGTSPYYGGGLRLFPFARLTLDKMHLRIGRIHPMVGFLNIPGIFAGSYRDKSENFGVLDFLTSDVTVRIAHEPFPFQHSGESIGEIDSFRMQVAKTPVRFVCFMKQRR